MSQLQYFDCYNTEDDIIFVDCFEDFPGTFNNCFGYHDAYYFDFYSQHHQTCTEEPTSITIAT